MDTLLLRDQPAGFRFRTTFSDRVGTLREKGNQLRLSWDDGRGPKYVHREFRVEPWPRTTS